MNENKIALIHMFITATIGVLLMSLVLSFFFGFGGQQPSIYKFLILLLFYPVSYFTIRLFIKTGVRNWLLGFLEGGIFAIIATLIVVVIVLPEVLSVIPLLFAFLIGGITGAIITIEIRKDYKSKLISQQQNTPLI